MKLLSLLASLILVSGQSVLMDTMPLPGQGAYTIGYINTTCRRMSMFKFPAISTGTAAQMIVGVSPTSMSQPCDVGFTLLDFRSGAQIGTNFVGAITTVGGVIGVPSSSLAVVMDVSKEGWNLVNNSLYYLQIQTAAGTRCQLTLPLGSSTPPVYAVVTQQGPANLPCGATPWTPAAAMDGGYIHMRLTALPSQSTSTSSSSTPSPSGSTTPSPSGSTTPSPSGSTTPSPSSSSTPSPSGSTTPTPSPSPTPTSNPLYSQCNSAIPSPSPSGSFVSHSYSGSQQTAGAPVNSPGIAVGSVIGALVVSLVVAGVVSRHIRRLPIVKLVVVSNPLNTA